jgi:hypothetical protein
VAGRVESFFVTTPIYKPDYKSEQGCVKKKGDPRARCREVLAERLPLVAQYEKPYNLHDYSERAAGPDYAIVEQIGRDALFSTFLPAGFGNGR